MTGPHWGNGNSQAIAAYSELIMQVSGGASTVKKSSPLNGGKLAGFGDGAKGGMDRVRRFPEGGWERVRALCHK